MAIFFTIVILGLSAGLGSSVSGALTSAQVGSPDLQILTGFVSANPTGALFGAFLGENPMQSLLVAASLTPGWVTLSPSVTASLLAPHFFANAIGPAFRNALGEAFLFAGGVTTLGALVSAVRGRRFIYDLSAPRRAAEGAAPSGGTGALDASTTSAQR